MPNLKLISMRLKSVTNIQKITMSMKMVSAAKYARAERDLKAARPLGIAAQHFYSQAEVGGPVAGCSSRSRETGGLWLLKSYAHL